MRKTFKRGSGKKWVSLLPKRLGDMFLWGGSPLYARGGGHPRFAFVGRDIGRVLRDREGLYGGRRKGLNTDRGRRDWGIMEFSYIA